MPIQISWQGATLGANTFTGAQVAPSLALGGATIGTNALAVTGTSTFSSTITTANITNGSSNWIGWSSRLLMRSPSDGVITLSNFAETDFSRLQFGGTTSSFPALKRSGSALQMRLADDSGNAYFQAASYYMNYNSFITDSSDGVIKLSNNAGTDFNRLQFGGTTSSFPAIKRVTTRLQVRLADDSANANIQAFAFVMNSGSSIVDSSDGVFRVTNSAGTDFSRLQFGGTTSSYPALARNGTSLDLKLADNSGYCAMTLHSLLITDNTNILRSTASMANGAGVSAGTLTNAPAAGNPTKWFAFNDNGVTRYIPAW